LRLLCDVLFRDVMRPQQILDLRRRRQRHEFHTEGPVVVVEEHAVWTEVGAINRLLVNDGDIRALGKRRLARPIHRIRILPPIAAPHRGQLRPSVRHRADRKHLLEPSEVLLGEGGLVAAERLLPIQHPGRQTNHRAKLEHLFQILPLLELEDLRRDRLHAIFIIANNVNVRLHGRSEPMPGPWEVHDQNDLGRSAFRELAARPPRGPPIRAVVKDLLTHPIEAMRDNNRHLIERRAVVASHWLGLSQLLSHLMLEELPRIPLPRLFRGRGVLHALNELRLVLRHTRTGAAGGRWRFLARPSATIRP